MLMCENFPHYMLILILSLKAKLIDFRNNRSGYHWQRMGRISDLALLNQGRHLLGIFVDPFWPGTS